MGLCCCKAIYAHVLSAQGMLLCLKRQPCIIKLWAATRNICLLFCWSLRIGTVHVYSFRRDGHGSGSGCACSSLSRVPSTPIVCMRYHVAASAADTIVVLADVEFLHIGTNQCVYQVGCPSARFDDSAVILGIVECGVGIGWNCNKGGLGRRFVRVRISRGDVHVASSSIVHITANM